MKEQYTAQTEQLAEIDRQIRLHLSYLKTLYSIKEGLLAKTTQTKKEQDD